MKTLLIILYFIPSIANAQLDTLVLYNNAHPRSYGHYTMFEQRMTDSLRSKTCHYICFDYNILNDVIFKEFISDRYFNKKRKQKLKQYETNKSLLNSKLNQVKVLVIENPSQPYISTEQSDIHDSATTVIAKVEKTLIGNIHIKEFTSLNVLYLQGNDFDYITELPSETYTLPIKTIYIIHVDYSKMFIENVKKKNSSINIEKYGVLYKI